MNIITDLHQHFAQFDPTIEQTMPFEINDIGFFSAWLDPLTMPKMVPDIPYTDLSRALLNNFAGTVIVSCDAANPAYYPDLDYIRLVPKQNYTVNPDTNFLHSFLHELSHASGHITRLDRPKADKGMVKYAKEELIAEQCAALLMNKYGLYEQSRDSHSKYIARWLHHGEFSDKLAVLDETSEQAQIAFDYMTRRNA